MVGAHSANRTGLVIQNHTLAMKQSILPPKTRTDYRPATWISPFPSGESGQSSDCCCVLTSREYARKEPVTYLLDKGAKIWFKDKRGDPSRGQRSREEMTR